MKSQVIDGNTISRALWGLRRDTLAADDPLLSLACVRLRVRSTNGQIAPAQALEGLLRAQVHSRLLALRQADDATATVDAGAPLDEAFAADFAVGNREREAWSTLFHYDLSLARPEMADLDVAAPVSKATLERRRSMGWKLLASELSLREATAARQLAELEPDRAALEAYLQACIERWSHPRYQLDLRFVRLGLLLDHGEQLGWRENERHFDSLSAVLENVNDTVLVLLGAPGSGKSTLLRQLEMHTAERGLAGEEVPIPFFVPLNGYRGDRPGVEPPAPANWLESLWEARNPELPPLDRLLEERRMLLLLDALNEMPHDDPKEFRRHVDAWKGFIQQLHLRHPGNRVLFSCRSLDYSAPLSTKILRVPQVRVEAMSEDRVRAFLDSHLSPEQAEATWSQLSADRNRLESLQTPYLLKLLVDQILETGEAPRGSVGLFAGFVRSTLRREIEGENPLLDAEGLISERDRLRILQATHWKTPHELPSGGRLLDALARLAFEMQRSHHASSGAQVRIDYGEAVAILGDKTAVDVLEAGTALGLLDLDLGSDEVLFIHQLLQEFFAARKLAENLDPSLVAAPWHAEEVSPSLEETLASLTPAEPLPPLPTTGWEETMVMATTMSSDPEAVLEELCVANLPLSGRVASQPEICISQDQRHRLSASLIDRSRDSNADLRARILATDALGRLGDPRFEKHRGQFGEFLLPPMCQVRGGEYGIWSHAADTPVPQQSRSVRLDTYRIGTFPVTRAEWDCFIRAGGYDDERWWDTEMARSWWLGVGTGAGKRALERSWRERFLADPELLDRLWNEGLALKSVYLRWKRWMDLDNQSFERMLVDHAPDRRLREPEFWSVDSNQHPLQPVVGISYHEATAYCCWMTAQSGVRFRVPNEAEWEAAAHGATPEAPLPAPPTRRSVGGSWTHLQRPAPVGVFPLGDAPSGVTDLLGSVTQWMAQDSTASAHSTDLAPIRGSEWQEARSESWLFVQRMHLTSARFADLGMRLCS